MSDLIHIPEETGAAAKSGADSIYHLLRKDVLSGRLSPNERLKVSSLAKRYGTSTNPIREALQQLRGEGFVIIEPNRGARVRRIDADFVRDIYEIEMLLEPHLVRWFVGQCTASDLASLEEIQAEIEKVNFADQRRHGQLDTQFHQLMYSRNYNRHAVEMWWRHREILGAINSDHGTSLRRQAEVLAEHRELLDAIRNHDEDAAAAVIMRHVQGSGKHIVERMRAMQAEAS